jgi:uncharacterized protein involved in type VI secretion and phage assembly
MNYSDLVTDESRDGLYGVYVGVVANIKDPENMGRVKVTFPWRDAADQSRWARIATPMAGKNMGTYFLPEKNDEVLVAFGDGDIHDPYVVGSLWNGKQKPPQKNTGKNPIRQIKSRAGHTITFDDTDGKGAIEIETTAGQHVAIDDTKKQILVNDAEGNSITMSSDGVAIDAKGDLSLSGKNVTIDASNNVSIGGNQISVAAKSKAALQSKGKVDIKSKGMLGLQAKGIAQIKSSGIVKVKGAMIMLN